MERGERSAYEVAILGEKEALHRLDLLASASRILDATLEDYGRAVLQVAELCVPDFADLCVVEVIGPDGGIQTAAYRVAHTSGLSVPGAVGPGRPARGPRPAAGPDLRNGEEDGRSTGHPGAASGPSRS